MSVQETGKEILGLLTEASTSFTLVAVIAFLVWTHGQEVSKSSEIHAKAVSELSNQLKASNFIQGMVNCADQECRDKFITTFTDWINLRKAGCE